MKKPDVETRRLPVIVAAALRLLAIATIAATAASAAGTEVEEELRYRWRLGGYKGYLARLVVPGTGDAVLRTTATEPGIYLHELHVTSPRSRRGEFWRYGAEVEGVGCDRLINAWTEQLFRGRAKERRGEIGESGILDVPSSICRIRRNPPESAIATRIWSDGKTYPVRISGPVAREAELGGRRMMADAYTVSGLRRPGERAWKGRLVLVVARDAARTPLEIGLVQPGLSVRLELAGDR